MAIQQGAQFLHAHWLQELPGVPVADWPPEVCIVATVTPELVYYRTLPDGNLWWVPVEVFEGLAVKEWVT